MFLIELFRNSSMYGILAILILYGTLQSIHTNPIESSSNETVKSENNPIEGRFGNQINEVEWLLNQLISMMADMVNGIERDHTLLQNNHFRHILSQIIKRIDFILEHFENLETHHLSSSILNELDRIDCIRIRLANYLSQSRRFDDRKCHQQWTNIMSPSASDSSHQLGKVLNQIIELLTKIADQLNSIEHELKQIHHQQNINININNQFHRNNPIISVNSPSSPKRPNIDWDRLISHSSSPPISSSSSSSHRPQANHRPTEQEWNQIFAQNGTSQSSSSSASSSSGTSTNDWEELISQVMGSMTSPSTQSSITRAPTIQPDTSSVTPAWEDVMNQLINQWNSNRSG
ncbi:hypothetical protein SSS_04546 [Sarcoptes scabiei]|uniref:Uncharacterized protein n=1 Tax=Sarcoptes scabiei TaxID=52283 RepID=A0A834VCE3_SARSC|nr:hypothetical protein SSS_04546 [Sarcoptes scabiei]